MKKNNKILFKILFLISITSLLFVSCPNSEMRDLVELKVSDPVADTFIINSGAATSSLTVTLNSDVTKEEDALEMRFKNSGYSWSEWETYSSTKTWTLYPGDGTKTVYAEYRDEGHHVVEMVNNIVLNTGAPSGDFYIWGSAVSGNQHEFINSTSVTLCMNITNVEKMRFSNDNSTWSGWTDYASATEWTLPSGDSSKTVYAEFQTNAGTTTSSTNSTDSGNPPVLDTTAPVVADFLINSGDEDAGDTGVTITYNYTEANELWAEYRNDGGSWSSQESVSSSPVSRSWTLRAEEGTRTAYTRLSDIAGNVSLLYSDSINLTTAAPAAPSVTAVTPTASTTPTWTWNEVSGAESYIYSFNDSTWSENITDTEYTPSEALTANTTHTLYVRSVDSEGRESESDSASVYIDTNGPSSITLDNINDTTFRTGETITMTFSVTDVSGIGSVSVQVAGYNATVTQVSGSTYSASYTLTEAIQSAQYAINVTALDSVGNELTVSPFQTITIDNSAPVISNLTINNGNTYSCSPVIQVSADFSENFTATEDLIVSINGTVQSGSSPYNVYAPSGAVSISVTDEAGNVSTDSKTITVKTGSTDINLEDQTLPSHLGSSAYDLGNMSDYESGGDHAYGTTYETYGEQNLWDEDWYEIYIDGGTSPYFQIYGLNSSVISGFIKIEVYYDEEGTQVAPSTYTDNSTDIVITLTDDFDTNQKRVWLKIYKDPSTADYTGAEYFVDWYVGYM